MHGSGTSTIEAKCPYVGEGNELGASQTRGSMITGIIPTIGRPHYLRRALTSLTYQTMRLGEIVVVDCSDDLETRELVNDPVWSERGLVCRYIHSSIRSAAAQRNVAVRCSYYPWLMLLEDDVEYEPQWVEKLMTPLMADECVAATMGRLSNHPYHVCPSVLWRIYHWLA